ncbi:ABC transporter ATP-binding protein [Micrococcus sp.]|uniref:ABC transporter ATP-binding protein n=1 Tax=Micrococcus sp. TaxID=1271 RepID=UPI002A917499|nr:ABC transporter ATP-binding protein [Micrococcus sp.]MDY6054605.1 ABC transporter ATP-binding protein [Micrococcus sp.]
MSATESVTETTPEAAAPAQPVTAHTGAEIRLEALTKRYPGQDRPAVDALDLVIPAGETVAFVGPSGCGKTTSLKMINRLIEPTSGAVLIDGEDVTVKDPTLLRRQIGYVIQGGGMMPHMSVRENIALVPRLLKWDRRRIAERVDELLELVGLDPAVYRDRYPRELSGGQQQRVGVARGLAADPPVLLMDEPFGAVDPITRQRLQEEMLDLQARLHKTVVIVTHDVEEAVTLGDRVLVLAPGARVAQYDRPERILAEPADEFVADFVGSGAVLKRLGLRRVGDLPLGPVDERSVAAGRTGALRPEDSLSDALGALIMTPGGTLPVVREDRVLGTLDLRSLHAHLARGGADAAETGGGRA